MNYISVTATEDNTTIKALIPNANAGSEILVNGTEVGYSPIEINLDENESYIIANNQFNPASNRFVLFGALIESVDDVTGSQDPTKPIVVNVGSSLWKNGTDWWMLDQGVDQLVPIQRV